MKSYLLSTIILIFALSFSTEAQNFKNIKKITADLEEQADKLTDRTAKDIKKSKTVTEVEIERAFLAEQLYGNTKVMRLLVDKKYPLSELRIGLNILLQMLPNFPETGSHINDWNEAKSFINSLDNEVNSSGNSTMQKKAKRKISGRVFWTGMVDATVQLVIRKSEVKTRTLSGKTYPDGIPSFTAPLPIFGEIFVEAKKKNGRGKIVVIQQPNAENDFTAIVQIDDQNSGAKEYTVEIFW